jgi:DNA-binding MarR family transcriptional regulator
VADVASAYSAKLYAQAKAVFGLHLCLHPRARTPPAETDLQRHFSVSPPSVHQMVLTLERTGLIHRKPGVARSIKVLVAPEFLPVLSAPDLD